MTDGDAKLRLLTDQFNEKFGTNIVHLRDYVHGLATIQKIIKSIYSDVTVEEFPEIGICFESLLKFSTTLIKVKLSPELNEKIFSNSILHLSGEHSELCLHNLEKQYETLLDPNKIKLYDAIKKKVDKASKIFGEIDSNFTTNVCENFFSLKSKFVPKNRFFGTSSKSRFEIAVLEHENPYLWFLDFIQFCNENHRPILELHPAIVDHLKEQRKLVENNRKYKSEDRIKNEEAFCKFLRRKSCLIEASTNEMGHEKGILLAKAKNSPFCQALVHHIYHDVEVKAAKKEFDLIESITKKIVSKEKKLQITTNTEEKTKELTEQINNLRANLYVDIYAMINFTKSTPRINTPTIVMHFDEIY